jgi:hypothetical protein
LEKGRTAKTAPNVQSPYIMSMRQPPRFWMATSAAGTLSKNPEPWRDQVTNAATQPVLGNRIRADRVLPRMGVQPHTLASSRPNTSSRSWPHESLTSCAWLRRGAVQNVAFALVKTSEPSIVSQFTRYSCLVLCLSPGFQGRHCAYRRQRKS